MALSVAPADRKGKIAGLYKGLTDLNRRCSSVLDKNIIIESFGNLRMPCFRCYAQMRELKSYGIYFVVDYAVKI